MRRLSIFLSALLVVGAVVAYSIVPILQTPPCDDPMGGNCFPARSWCWHESPDLIALHDSTNTVIWLEYLVLPGMLLWLTWVEGLWKVAWAFPVQMIEWGAFIFCCGLTHLFGRVEIYAAVPWTSGTVLAVCAIVGLVAIVHTLVVLPQIRMWMRSVKVSSSATSGHSRDGLRGL